MASDDNNSIGAQIDRLAELTGAPTEFVARIRSLFSTKGISLDDDSAPYLSALEHAFRREQSIRVTAQQTRRHLERLQTQLAQFNDACRRQLSRLKQAQDNLGRSSGPSPAASSAREIHILEISDDDGLRVRRTKTLLVPGPDEMQ